ncbi:Flap endonuclease XPG family protein [Giardia muris]|uniref:Flap endonuclease XPG family protein n=1 Tax=Giardia muris TaxID=5742 RepID=A0A4Z1SU80_GIAMU|nr:Flap endonuclease XPG family protein [Giardia muris]|eukprot:TNJ27168.1 Flap endonuclease XPG family protein [Giardia muris]
MGVRSLWRLLQALKTPPRELGAASTRQVAVDVAGLLYMHYSVRSRDDVNGYHASSALYIILEILEAGWRPVFVFDSGKPSWLKKAELQRRHAAQQEGSMVDDEEVQQELALLKERVANDVRSAKERRTEVQQNVSSNPVSNTYLEEVHRLLGEIQAEVASLTIGGQNQGDEHGHVDTLILDRELNKIASMHQEKVLRAIGLKELWNPLVHQKRAYARNMLKAALTETEVAKTQNDLLLRQPIPWLTPSLGEEEILAEVPTDMLQDDQNAATTARSEDSHESSHDSSHESRERGFDLFGEYYGNESTYSIDRDDHAAQILASLDRLTAHNAVALAKEYQVQLDGYMESTSIDIHPSSFFSSSNRAQSAPFETSTSTFLKFVNYRHGTGKRWVERSRETFLDDKIRREVASIAQLFQIPSLCSKPGIESEQVCAYLCKEGYAFATITNDSDAFLFGTPLIFRRESGVKKLVAYSQDTWQQYFSVADITFLAFLLGCDFCPGVLGFGPISAVETLLYVKYLLHPPSWLGLAAPTPRMELMELIVNFKSYYVSGDIPVVLKANSRQLAERYINVHYVIPYPEVELPPSFSSKDLGRIREEVCLKLRQTRQTSLRMYSTDPETSFATFSKNWNHIARMVHKETRVREMCIPITEGEALPDRILASLETPVSTWDPLSPILASPTRLERLATLTSLPEDKVRQLLVTGLAGLNTQTSSPNNSTVLDPEVKPEASKRLSQALFALAIFTRICRASTKPPNRAL